MIFLDLEFIILRDIKSLPPWPGARWNALMRLAAHAAGVEAESACLALAPQRWGQTPWRAGEPSRLRLQADQGHLELTRALLRALRAGGLGRDEFVAGESLKLVGLSAPGTEGGGAGQLEDFIGGGWTPRPLDDEALRPELAALEHLGREIELDFIAPLRLILSKASGTGAGHFAGPDFFEQPEGLTRFLRRLRLPEGEAGGPFGQGLEADGRGLKRFDLCYSRERSIKLGGLVGRLILRGRPDYPTWRRLVWGQYLGAGKNARFGFGFYRLPALDSLRPWPLYPGPAG